MKTISRCGWIAVFVFVASNTTAFAQQDNVPNWSISPYIWTPTTTLDLTVRDTNIGSGEIPFNDLVDSLDAAFILQVEVGEGKWGAFGDLNYLETSDTASRTVFTIDVPGSLNTILVATVQPTNSSNLDDWSATIDEDEQPLLYQAISTAQANLVPTVGSDIVFTDQRAQVETIIDSIVIRYILEKGPAGLSGLGG